MRCCSWSKQAELEFWVSEPEEQHIQRIRQKYELFSAERLISTYISRPRFTTYPTIIMDVGGGMFGGGLCFYHGRGQKILVDVLGEDYVKAGHLSSEVLVCTSDFDHIPFVSNTVAVIFAWEVLDHALTWEHFQQGQRELVRLLAPGGLLFFQLPLRPEGDNLHIPTSDEKEIMDGFAGLQVIDEFENEVPGHTQWTGCVFTVMTKDKL